MADITQQEDIKIPFEIVPSEELEVTITEQDKARIRRAYIRGNKEIIFVGEERIDTIKAIYEAKPMAFVREEAEEENMLTVIIFIGDLAYIDCGTITPEDYED